MAKLYRGEIHFFHLINTPVEWISLDKEQETQYSGTLKRIVSAKADLVTGKKCRKKRTEMQNLP